MKDPVLSSLLRINRQRIRALRNDVLTPNQYVGIMHLIVLYTGNHPGASQEEIVNFFALDKTSVARGARRLEEMNHLRRTQDPSNRRQYQLFLTPAGEKMREVIECAHNSFQQQLAGGISDEDWALLASLLQRLEKNICPDPPPEQP
jgi:DNA-binding MarR family transcriptional regulator